MHSSGNFHPVGEGCLKSLSSCSLSVFAMLDDPVRPSTPSTSAGLSKRFGSAACATGGCVGVVVVVVVVAVVVADDAGLLWLSPPHAATNTPTAAMASEAANWRTCSPL